MPQRLTAFISGIIKLDIESMPVVDHVFGSRRIISDAQGFQRGVVLG